MKKFSFLLIGAFLLWTITFALAEDAKESNATTWKSLTTETTAVAESTTWDTAEATTWDTAEVTTWDTAEATTWDTAEATTWDTAEVTTWDTAEATTWDAAEPDKSADVVKSKYSEEQVAAYEWALQNGITTINDIEKARLTDGLTRAELAKMMSQYMTKVMWKTPVDAEKVEYADVDESLGDLADYIQTAYAYKIMWINADGTPIKKFNPRGKVTRAEYATVFSRVLFGDKYNKSEWNYYENHLNALKEAGILTNTTPTIQEVRGWVMLMMYRSSQNGEAIEKVANATVTEETSATAEETAATEENKTEEAATEGTTGTTIWMPNPAAVYCEQQWGTVNIVKDAEGNETWMCKLGDGTEVDEWEYYRANNPTTEETTTEEATTEGATTEQPANTEKAEALTGDATATTSDKE